MMALVVFAASFVQVFCLGLNSKLCRDDKILAAFFVSWLITFSQYAFIWGVTQAGLGAAEFIIAAGFGGSIGITSAQYFYIWYDKGAHSVDSD